MSSGGRGGGGFRGGDRGGFRGGDRGGGGRGGSRGRPPTFRPGVSFYSNSEKDQQTLLRMHGRGWLEFDFARKEEVIIQTYEGPAPTLKQQEIAVSVNHFKITNFKLPKDIFHYEVTMERVKRGPSGPPAGNQGKKTEVHPKKGKPAGKQKPGASGGGGGGGGGGGDEGGDGQPPKKMPKPLPQLILEVVLKKIREQMKFYGVVTDFSNNLYSTKMLEGNISMEYMINMQEVDQTILQDTDDGFVKVKIERSQLEIDTRGINEQLQNFNTFKGFRFPSNLKTPIEMVYNAVLKSIPNYRYLPLGRSNLIAWPDKCQSPLDWKIEVWRGITANIHMGWQPYLNVDIAHSAFLQDLRVVDAVQKEFRGAPIGKISEWSSRDLDQLRRLLKTVKITYTVKKNGRDTISSGPVTDVLHTSPKDTKFLYMNREISVADYFATQYNVRLQNPDGLCLVIRKDSKVPAEICTIKKGQSYNKKLDEEQTRSMLGIAKKDPSVLHQEIMESMKKLNMKGQTLQAQILKEFGVGVSDNMLRLDKTRVLAPPGLLYGEGTNENQGKGSALIVPDGGQWDIWSHSFKFFTSAQTIQNWGVLEAGDCRVQDSNIENFVRQMMDNAVSKGIKFENRPIIFRERNIREFDGTKNVAELRRIFQQQFVSKKCELVVVIIPKKFSSIYSHVKQASELAFGNGKQTVLTQCVVGQNVFKGQFATIQNILLKINSKLGGVNHVVIPNPSAKVFHMLGCPCLIIGADVTHPPPGTTIKVKGQDFEVPSFCSVTGSIDKTCMPYMMDIRAQRKAGKGAAEVIQDLEAIILLFLQTFEKKTQGIRPRKIIYMRDGVGEGQFPEVLHVEMTAIRRACGRLKDFDGEDYKPKITFITVQKRHKTRMFYHNGNRVDNAPPGTVVDTEIVHQTEMDFYLMSQKGMMGTSRPTRYHVLWDDSKFSADDIQQFVYYLCYMYVRCNKSVKIPAPTYYAHWAAARAKALSDGMEESFANLNQLNERLRRHPDILSKFPMHFV